ncbi:hypothetical protein CkaCkLH20_02521 [Colletotrichum karsti]|uniref:Small secreted protein n=1 Tax=Colletotrichum karsti TaxID=1095194 RepID=A0A9P6IBR0_9PEZI|nr:uncharacterized protein CkaCkLH20_02521 [Colletotrichum karsti]KAF9879710.1 hypothetical protein CkaCkLH20_02521 [Colletotrichum karsti]
MQLTKTLLTLLMGMTVASALALPPQAKGDDLVVRAEAATNAAAADKDKNKDKNKNKTNNGAKAKANNGKPNAKAQDCANAKKLAAGIDKNIEIQKKEQSNVAAIEKIVNSNNPDKGQFDKAKQTLLKTIDDGIKVRTQNQELAKGNGAAAGLEKVKNAQATELKQAQGLKGTKGDLNTIAEMKKEFAGGIDQNTKNKQAVSHTHDQDVSSNGR